MNFEDNREFLSNPEFLIFQHDVHRKPQGLIILDEKCRVSRADGANTFEIATEGKTYYLTADSQPLMEDWVRVLQNVVQRNALRLLLSKEDGISPTLQVRNFSIELLEHF